MNHPNTWVDDYINKVLWIVRVLMRFLIVIERVNLEHKRLNENFISLRFLPHRNKWLVNLFGTLNIWWQLIFILIQRATNNQNLEYFHQELLSFLLIKDTITFWLLHQQTFSYLVTNLNSFKIFAHTLLYIIAFNDTLFLELVKDF